MQSRFHSHASYPECANRFGRTTVCWILTLAVTQLTGTGLSYASDLQLREQESIRAAVQAVAPSVVQIETVGGLEQIGRSLVGTGPTTGLIVAADGLIVSSAFNFVQQPTSILITLPDNERKAATIVARDHSRMLVLLKVHTERQLPVPRAVPRDDFSVGQWAIALGRTFDAEQPNVSVGILSATNRIWGKAIQTDAKISPSNYGGPLVDLKGRVMGVLVPLSPQGQNEMAGAEWYDSGIGFAVPLDDINRRLPQWREGKDLYAGLIGINLKGNDIYSDPAIVAAVGFSPASRAGIKPGDEIVAIEGQPIVRQAQLKHLLGPHYAGDVIQVTVSRGDERFERTIELTDKITPYAAPFLGILPSRIAPSTESGVLVRFVYPGSPAAEAGIEPGDRVMRLKDRPATDSRTLREYLAGFQEGDPITVSWNRGATERQRDIKLASLPTDVPAELPAARKSLDDDQQTPPLGDIDLKLPEEPNQCIAYVPNSYSSSVPHGLVIWLPSPGKLDRQKLIDRWQELCGRHDLILLAPQATDSRRWKPTEVDIVRRFVDQVRKDYAIDSTRVVAHGYQAGASMAYRVAFRFRDLIRGVAAVDAAIPSRIQPPTSDPVNPLAIYTTSYPNNELTTRIDAGNKLLSDRKLPVTLRELDKSRYLDQEELAELARWIDALDRL